jgi:hypothetical protein
MMCRGRHFLWTLHTGSLYFDLIEGKKTIFRDIVATNGVIHVVEDVLIPDYVQTSLLNSVKSKSKLMAELLEKSGSFFLYILF